MLYELAHRPAGTADAVHVTLDAGTSRAAIDQLRSEVPDDHLILYVRVAPLDTPELD